MRQKRANPYHPDITIFLVTIPFISAFNYYLTYTNIRLNWFLLTTFVIDTLQGYAAWYGVRSFIFHLDKRLPYDQRPATRLVIQLAATCLIGLTIISVLTELTAWIARGRPASKNFYTFDLFIISIWFLVMNGVYIGLYYYNQWKASNALITGEALRAHGLIVRVGKQNLRLDYNDLAGFYFDDDYAIACHRDGKKFVLEQSLDRLEKSLPPSIFFRLNRQYILHRDMMSGFKRIENGKIVVQLARHEVLPAEIAVSRTKAPAFKRWFMPA